MADIGLQAAVVYGMVSYLLSHCASPLFPRYYIVSEKEYRDPPPPFLSQNPHNYADMGYGANLHSCANAGNTAVHIGQMMLDKLKPGFSECLTPAQHAALSACAVEITLGKNPSGRDDPLLDGRDASDCTVFF
jgi:hypothetical protein